MIVSFAGNDTEEFYHSGRRPSWLPPDASKRAFRKLDLLNGAKSLIDLRSPPGNRLEQLKGDMQGLYSIRINDQWRIVFRWTDGNAHQVRVVDYH